MFGIAINTAHFRLISDFFFQIVHEPVFAPCLLAVCCAISATAADAATQFSHRGH